MSESSGAQQSVIRVLDGLSPSEVVREGLLLVSLPASAVAIHLQHSWASRSVTPFSAFIVVVFSLFVCPNSPSL